MPNDELPILCNNESVHKDEVDWRVIKVMGPLGFSFDWDFGWFITVPS